MMSSLYIHMHLEKEGWREQIVGSDTFINLFFIDIHNIFYLSGRLKQRERENKAKTESL